ncbi:MAG: acetyl-CoA carboxylase, carboxyltransferase subunit beta [Bacillota bacterium]|nr:acetyl-CoA carboxylase, carboxyltransferase subunit beta [Bacillota bacterium]
MVDKLRDRLRRRVDHEREAFERLESSVRRPGAESAANDVAVDLAPALPARPYAYRQPIPDDLWIKCPACNGIMFRDEFHANASVCQHCNHHFRIGAPERIALVVDPDSFVEHDRELASVDPIGFDGYLDRLAQLRRRTGLTEAVVTGRATIGGLPCHIGAMDSRFLMGSMGSVVGEKITRLFERATAAREPVILFTVSGGARMQEGILSLMQMAKTSAARGRHRDAGLLYIAVLTDPTTGGVTASFASLGDYLISEPGTLIGFAGRRVIEGTIAEQLPEDFQRAEFLQGHGFLDMIVGRHELRPVLEKLLLWHQRAVVSPAGDLVPGDAVPAASDAEMAVQPIERTGSACLTQIRQKGRPTADLWLGLIFDDLLELEGDRRFGEDEAIWGGLALLDGRPVTVIATRKGRDLAENQRFHFGMPHPEGYRKALRLMQEAARVGRPIITFIDTPGAYCGVGAEERGQGEAIAVNLMEMMQLGVPVVSVVTGEGGSGGALAIAVSDRLAMLSNATYSVISPRGFASLLWKDASREEEAADCSAITAFDLRRFGVCDQILAEPEDGAGSDPELVARRIKRYFLDSLAELDVFDGEELKAARYERFRRLGEFSEGRQGD